MKTTTTRRADDTRLRTRKTRRYAAECTFCGCPDGCGCSPSEPCACGSQKPAKAGAK